MWRALKHRAKRDTGAVLVLFALFLPVALVFSGFVIDVANWFEHKRHLQTQADAAALAGAGSFLACPNNEPIMDKTEEYGGATWNSQVGDAQDSVHMEVNSETFFDQPGYTDPTVSIDPPCESGMVDVKLTETDLPWWFDVTQDVDYINAHARAEFKEVDELGGALPFGVPDVKPTAARVWFVNEDTGEILTDVNGAPAQHTLSRRTYANGVAVWDNLDSTVDITLPSTGPTKIGARVALSGSTSTTCGQPLVVCYALGTDLGNANGILYARAWHTETATQTAPKARHIGLTSSVSGGCPNPYFTEVPAAGCNVGMVADIDLGGGTPSNYNIDAVVGNKQYALQYDTVNARWVSNQLIAIDEGSDPVPIALDWKRGSNSGSFGVVQRVFRAGSRSGPIKQASLVVNGASGVSSLEQCSQTYTECTYQMAVQLGIQGSFEDLYEDLQSVTTPVTLRFAGGTPGSQNQALDCDPWNEDPAIGGGRRSFVDEMAYGCRPKYTFNQGSTACPSQPNDIWGASTGPDDQGDPWQCVAVETGDRVNQVATGLNIRILGDSSPHNCTHPNNWDQSTQAPDPASAGDPRIVHLFLTQFGAFGSSGQDTVAVTNFATFYVTGWRGNGNGNPSPCVSPPAPAKPDDPVPQAGTVVGHFMKYRGPLGDNHGTKPCNFDGPTPCVFALTE